MSRALTIQRTLVTPPERERFHEKLRRKHEYYANANCRYWVFEEVGLPGVEDQSELTCSGENLAGRERRPDPDDLRSKRVALTDRGTSAIEVIREAVAADEVLARAAASVVRLPPLRLPVRLQICQQV